MLLRARACVAMFVILWTFSKKEAKTRLGKMTKPDRTKQLVCPCSVNSLLGKDSASPILHELNVQCAASTICTFFEEKIQTIWTGLEADENSSEYQPSFFVVENLSEFSPVIEDQLAKTISNCKPTSLSVDPIPTKIVLDCLDVLLPVLST